MEIKIRKATYQDCEALCEIHVSAIRELGRTHYSEEEIDVWSRGRTPGRYEKHISERDVIIAENKSIPMGFGTLDLATGELVQLYVHPKYARKGIGTLILEELMNMARKAGLGEMHCFSSLNAEAFYISAGFQAGHKCKRQLNGGEIECVPMRKSLQAI